MSWWLLESSCVYFQKYVSDTMQSCTQGPVYKYITFEMFCNIKSSVKRCEMEETMKKVTFKQD